jgi:Protein of unknown function (DUF2971)
LARDDSTVAQLPVLESIMRTGELWFTNPMLMNDKEEVIFGIRQGAEAFVGSDQVPDACGDPRRFELLGKAFLKCVNTFEALHAVDTYVLCFSEHDPVKNKDGLLSMWRGYGQNGGGAAIVFDASKVNVLESSPFLLTKVVYESTAQRLEWIQAKIAQFCDLLKRLSLSDEKLPLASHVLFERFKLFALCTKHSGFAEEQEWRAIDMPDRDPNGVLKPMLDYSIGPRGIEPKLKFKVGPIESLFAPDLSLEKVVDHILIGPTSSAELAMHAVRRMLVKLGRDTLAERVRKSEIPLRA